MKSRAWIYSATAGLLLWSAGCVPNDYMVTISGAMIRRPPLCDLDGQTEIRLSGKLDVEDTLDSGGPNPRTYATDFYLRTDTLMKSSNTSRDDSPSFPSYGTLNDTDIFIEEVQISYDWIDSAPPSAETLAAIPSKRVFPVGAVVSDLWITKAAPKADTQTAALPVELIPSSIGYLLADDPEVAPFLDQPNTYTLNTKVKLVSRTTAGFRNESSEYNFPIKLCRRCIFDLHPDLCNECYPQWQDDGCDSPFQNN